LKNLIILAVVSVFVVCGCEDKTYVAQQQLEDIQGQIVSAQKDLSALKEQTQEIKMQESVKNYFEKISDLRFEKNRLGKDVSELDKELDHKKALVEDRVVYLVTIELKQSHFSINPLKHIKDSMNAVEFQFPTNKEYYDSLSVGEKVLEEFRSGSFLMEGSFGDWNVTVLKKETKIEEDNDEE
jgi:conjugal transfer/entry exclusion protein